MRVVVVGSGAREHALASVLGRTAEVTVTPGNPGSTAVATNDATPPTELEADLFVIGPEIPLVDGLADRLRAQGKRVFGPGADGAQFEGSKTWMKRFFVDHGIPTARHAAFDDPDLAVAFLRDLPGLYVVKADGPAAGKGVFVTESLAEAEDDVRSKLSGESFGDAGRRVVIEEGMTGPEISVMAITDGSTFAVLAPAQDHKRIGDGDTGPNTGGMGAYSPVPFAPKTVIDEIAERVFEPTIAGLRAEGIDYRGVLYAGLMLTPDGPKMVEYNVRFGDPEAQVVLPRIAPDCDLAEVLAQAADGHLTIEPRFVDDAAVTVVLATGGYPEKPKLNDTIKGVADAEALEGITVFHAGTARSEGRLATAGGRVLAVTAVAPTLEDARARAYEAAGKISFDGMQYRRDIAHQAVEEGSR
jgi:phosphoribosylamine--glycine ligase